ncbi:MAG TPA: DMT family protein, partial [Lacipirellulaceae bacterium]|nr:DMT family protein [Lacipirellulaceae bacterium]
MNSRELMTLRSQLCDRQPGLRSDLCAHKRLRDITRHFQIQRNDFMNPIVTTILLLCGSNIFMTFAWYGHLKNLGDKPLLVAVLASWGIAFFEYLLQVPAN